MGLACYTARMSSVPLEQDEKISLCYLGLVLAAGSFDPDRGIRFATFAVPVMQNKILQGLRREKKHFGAISLEQPVGKDDGGTLADLVPDPGNSFRDLEELLDFQDAVKRTGRELSGKKLRAVPGAPPGTRDWHRRNTGKGLGAASPWYQDG